MLKKKRIVFLEGFALTWRFWDMTGHVRFPIVGQHLYASGPKLTLGGSFHIRSEAFFCQKFKEHGKTTKTCSI